MIAIKVWRGFWRVVHLGAPFVACACFIGQRPELAIIAMMVGLIAG